jgi:UMF1 family MFS transporter
MPRRAVAAWILFDPAAQPVYTLITTFVFAPYFAGQLAATPAAGQALWGFATAAAGVVIALAAPVLGAVADAAGQRKPWIAAFSLLLVAGCALLWWTPPQAPSAIVIALAGYVVATIGVEFATVFTNGMMPDLVPAERLGRLSGTGWAAGYVGGLLALGLMLAFALADPASGRTLLGLPPIFGLDPAAGGGARLSGRSPPSGMPSSRCRSSCSCPTGRGGCRSALRSAQASPISAAPSACWPAAAARSRSICSPI